LRIGAHRKRPVGLALISLLVCGPVPVAIARADSPAPTQLAAAIPARPVNEPPDRTSSAQVRLAPAFLLPETSLDAPVSPAPLIANGMRVSYVDPAGGHRPIRPIEISTPYRVR
jgi:hypothetical protein